MVSRMETLRWRKIRGTLVSLRRKFYRLYFSLCFKRFDNDPRCPLTKSRFLYEIPWHYDSWPLEVWRSISPASSLDILHAFPWKTTRKRTGKKIWALPSHCNSIGYRFASRAKKWRNNRRKINALNVSWKL